MLLQIISEHEDRGTPMFSATVLSQIIRFYGDSLQGFVGSYLERSLQTFLEQSQQFRSQLNNVIGQTPWTMLNEMTERNLDMWKSMQNRFLSAASSAVRPATPPRNPSPQARPSASAEPVAGGDLTRRPHLPTIRFLLHRTNPR